MFKIKKTFYFLLAFILGLSNLLPKDLLAGPPSNAISLFEEGKNAQEEGNYYLAIEKYKAALNFNPNYFEPIKGLAECFFFLDEYNEALRYVELGKKYNRANPLLLNLEGRIYIVQGRLEQARTVFNQILSQQPNNLDAMTGIALLEVAGGRVRFAAKQLEDALKVNPTNRITLLALALIYENLGELNTALYFLELALRYHSNNHLVHYFAGRFFYLREELIRSESHLKTSLALQPEYQPARLLLGNINLLQGKPERAVEVLKPLLSIAFNQALPRYLLGLAYWQLNELENAVRSFEAAQSLSGEDEWSKLALEHLALTALDQNAAKRKSLAQIRLKQGKLFEGRSLLTQALLEYRRSIKLDPVLVEARLAFAGIFKKRGFSLKYLNELEVIKELGLANQKILDEIDYYKMKEFGTVAKRWGVDQHDLTSRTVSVKVFSLANQISLLHPLSTPIISSFFKDVLDAYPKLEVVESQDKVSSFEEAFRIARTAKMDYFIMLDFSETERSFKANLKLYLAKTGSLLASFNVERTGNNRIRDSLLKLGERVVELLPLRGILLQKKFDRGLIDLGSMHQLKLKDELLIVKAGKTTLRSDGLGFNYRESDVVGKIIIEALDEAVAEGSLQKKSFYDYITTGDEVLIVPKEQVDQKMKETSVNQVAGLLEELTNLK